MAQGWWGFRVVSSVNRFTSWAIIYELSKNQVGTIHIILRKWKIGPKNFIHAVLAGWYVITGLCLFFTGTDISPTSTYIFWISTWIINGRGATRLISSRTELSVSWTLFLFCFLALTCSLFLIFCCQSDGYQKISCCNMVRKGFVRMIYILNSLLLSIYMVENIFSSFSFLMTTSNKLM